MEAVSRDSPDLVTTARLLFADGVSRRQLDAELRARRWQRIGLAIVLHNGPLSAAQRYRVARIHAGPRSLLTAFTAAQVLGVRGWEREPIDLLAPAGTRMRAGCPLPTVLHLHGARPIRVVRGGGIEILPDALLRAAGTFTSPRPGCGLLAAAVQQRRTDCPALLDALDRAPRVRHRAQLVAAVRDIAGGSLALSEIDFVRLCRRHRLPAPEQQYVRRDSTGKRRYLDATWRRRDGKRVVVEVDGAMHTEVSSWWADQSRQNDITLGDAMVLRFPSTVLRTDEATVARQLRSALGE